jgi:hypothetical protein
MTKPMIRIHNTETDEILDREMTNAEFAAYKADNERLAEETAQLELKAEAKASAQAKLAALGLTIEDLTALGL